MDRKMQGLWGWLSMLLLVCLLSSGVLSIEATAEAAVSIPTIDGYTTTDVHDAGGGYSQLTYSGVTLAQMKNYEQTLRNNGYSLYDQREIQNGTNTNRFATYVKGETMIHLNLFAPLSENQFHVIYGPSDKLVPNAQAGSYIPVVTPSVAIIERTDLVLCMVVQLADGSYYVIDGGRGYTRDSFKYPASNYRNDPDDYETITPNHSKDMKTLLEYLQDTNRDGKIDSKDTRPQVTWMITHADVDHIHLPYVFMKTYSNKFDLQAVYYNFPNYAEIGLSDTYTDEIEGLETKAKNFVSYTNTYFPYAKEYIYHTGQTVNLPGCTLEFLYAPEDLYPNNMTSPNHTCGMWRFCFDNGKTFLVTGDAEVSTNKQAAAVLGSYLQSDMLQVIHHGYNGGTAEFYSAVDPDICFWPCLDIAFRNDKQQLGTYSGYSFNKILRNGERTHYATSSTHTVFLPTLRYDANDGTGTAILAGAMYGSNTANEGDTPNGAVTVATNTFTAPKGKLFHGWATTPDGDVEYRPGEQIEVKADTVLYAVWKADSYTGTCGNNLTWMLDMNGTLTISGTGDIPSYSEDTYTEAPWSGYEPSIKQVVIGNGITGVGDYAFASCSDLICVTIPDSVTNIGDCVFYECRMLYHVFYAGTQSQWSAVPKGIYNNFLTAATRHYNMKGYTQIGCAAKGLYCSICEDTIIPDPNVHSYDNGMCTICGYKETDHNVKHVKAVAATCYNTGNVEYWYCASCGQVWLDAECTQEADPESVKLPMTEAIASIGSVNYGSLEAAMAVARKTPEPDTITLLENINISSWVVINTEVTLVAEKPITISGAKTQVGSMFRVIDGGKLTILGASEDAKITLVAGVNTTNLVVTHGGEAILTNVRMEGNTSPRYLNRNKACGIFNDGGTITAKCVEIANMKGDSIYILDDGIVNLDDVTITNSGRYGIKVKGILNILNTMNADHALTVCGSGNNAIDIENGGKAVSHFESVSESTALIRLINNREGICVRIGGTQELTNVSTT